MASKGAPPPPPPPTTTTKDGHKQSIVPEKGAEIPGNVNKHGVGQVQVPPHKDPPPKNSIVEGKKHSTAALKQDELKIPDPSGEHDISGKHVHSSEVIGISKKKSMSRYGNLIMDQTSDHWDEGLIPQILIDEIYNELQYESGSEDSQESYDEITESGTVIKKYRKKRHIVFVEEEESIEEEEEIGPYRLSVTDVDGGIPKAKLKAMSIKKLSSVHKKINIEIEFIKTENFIMDRTVQKMEKRELEIEAALPAFTYQFPWEKNNTIKSKTRDTNQDTCETNLSSDEENDTGVYIPFIPANEIDFNDPFFDDMSDQMKEATTNQMKELGEIAPFNFDIIRYTYGDLVKSIPNEILEPHEINSMEYHGVNQSENKKDIPNASQALLMKATTTDLIDDEDPEFPGFVMKQAKKLPISEKLKYANIEEESLREEFFDDETKGIQQENSIQVYIDTFINSVELIRKLQDNLKEVIAGGYHPLTGRMKAESIIRFRIMMKNKLLAEETKLTMALNELKKRKKKVDEQVKSNRDLGESIQLIDYEQLRIENAQFQGNIDEQHDTLKQLKIITGGKLQQLKEHRTKLQKKMIEYKHIHDDIFVRGVLKDGFDENTKKYSTILTDLKSHNDFLRKRLKVFKAPSTIDYMHQKASQNGIQEEVNVLKKKLESLELNLKTGRNNIHRIQKKVPHKDIKKINKDWLEEIKCEVNEKGLINLLENENDPMGGSMRTFFKKSSREHEHRLVQLGNKNKYKELEKIDSDIPSKIKLGPEELTAAKVSADYARKSIFISPNTNTNTTNDTRDHRESKSHGWDWEKRNSSLKDPHVRNNSTNNDQDHENFIQGKRKTLTEVKTTFASDNRKESIHLKINMDMDMDTDTDMDMDI